MVVFVGLFVYCYYIFELKIGSCLEEFICMRDKKIIMGNEREIMIKKWIWILYRDMVSNEFRWYV